MYNYTFQKQTLKLEPVIYLCEKLSPESDMECKFCLKLFHTKNGLKRHVKTCKKDPDFEPFVCHKCNASLAGKSSLRNHITKHCEPARTARSNLCLVSNCSFTYYFKKRLVEHLKVAHGKVLKPEENLTFQNQSSFLHWKNFMERKTFSYYSLHCGERKGTLYYYCQFDGSGRSHEKADADKPKRKRKPPSKGRVKTGSVCTSMIIAKKQENGSILVTFSPSHCHEVSESNLKYQPLNSELRTYIDQQIYRGVPLVEIRETLKNKFPGVKRIDLIKMKTLRERRRRLLLRRNFENEGTDETDYFENEGTDETDHFENDKMNYLENIQGINSELMERINSENFPVHLLPHIEEVLSNLLAECSQGEKKSQEFQPQTQTPQNQIPKQKYDVAIKTQTPIKNEHIIPHESDEFIIEEVFYEL